MPYRLQEILVYIPVPKNRDLSVQTVIQFTSYHISKFMLKCIQFRLKLHKELPDIEAGFRTGSGTRDDPANAQ